jgi:tRNA threonylcarbamoyl adenosine modification protein YeaZ
VLALVIDTSSAAVTAGVVECTLGSGVGGATVTVRAERVVVDARAHGELLAVLVKASVDEAGAAMADLEAVIAGVGPGPFTGLRVGLVTAAALSDALRIPAYDVCSLDAIAAAAAVPDLLVAADARRREVYWACYRHGQRVAGPAVNKPAELPLAVDFNGAAIAGAGARLYADVLRFPLLDNDYPTVAGLAQLAADRVVSGAPSEALTPLYLRRPDAVAATGHKSVSQR